MSHLSFTFFTDEPGQQPTSLPSTVNKELIAYITNKALSKGYGTIKDLAKAFGTKNHDKVIRNLKEFCQTSQLNPNYFNQLINILSLDKAEIDAIHKQHHDKLNAEMDLYIKHFDFIFKHGNVILRNEKYRNITFHGLYLSCAWIGRRRPLTLGELFYHYKHGEWIMPDCCGSVYVISGGGSALSGRNNYQGFCSKCKQVYYGSRPSFGEILRPFIKNEPDFEYEPTDYTVRQLVDDLLILESK